MAPAYRSSDAATGAVYYLSAVNGPSLRFKYRATAFAPSSSTVSMRPALLLLLPLSG